MLTTSVRLTKPLRRFRIPRNLCSISSSEAQVLSPKRDQKCDGFLAWLEKKAGAEVSSKLYIGKSKCGKSLFASQTIKAGDCLFKVPYNAQLSPEILMPQVRDLLGNEVGDDAKVAIVVLAEQRRGKKSDWAPYIRCLPQLEEMHNTIFWTESELEMIRPSIAYQETINLRAQLEKAFLTVINKALQKFPENFGSVTLIDFMHAYALVKSRAWGSTRGVSLIPFADFSNHDGASKAFLLNDYDKQVSEVNSDRNYAPHEEVLINYGKFSNGALLLDFGFTLPYNTYDQVQISIPNHDFLREQKLEIFRSHRMPTIEDVNGFDSSGNFFMLREVGSITGKGKGIPQSLRAFARVLSCASPQELNELVVEAAQNDGRLARRPFSDSNSEIQAHKILLSVITELINDHDASIKKLELIDSTTVCERFARRLELALNLLTGELRILKSASAWLKNYCTSLSQSTANNDATI